MSFVTYKFIYKLVVTTHLNTTLLRIMIYTLYPCSIQVIVSYRKKSSVIKQKIVFKDFVFVYVS